MIYRLCFSCESEDAQKWGCWIGFWNESHAHRLMRVIRLSGISENKRYSNQHWKGSGIYSLELAVRTRYEDIFKILELSVNFVFQIPIVASRRRSIVMDGRG